MSRSQRNRPHREMVYDPQWSTRAFKRVTMQGSPGERAEEAWSAGVASVVQPHDLPRRMRTNPYGPGRRHDLYEAGAKAARLDEDERRTERRWRA